MESFLPVHYVESFWLHGKPHSGLLPVHASFFKGILLVIGNDVSAVVFRVKDNSPLYKEGNFHVLVGDGVK